MENEWWGNAHGIGGVKKLMNWLKLVNIYICIFINKCITINHGKNAVLIFPYPEDGIINFDLI